MATPVQRTSHVPTTPAAPATATAPVEPVPVVAPLGWALAIAAAVGLLLASWLVYPLDGHGMWAGYWATVFGAVVILAAMWLRSSLPATPAIGVVGLSGIALVLFGAFLHDVHRVVVTELTAGAVLLLAAGLLASGPTRR